MPKQHRYALKQDLTTAIGELTKAQVKMTEVAEEFLPSHPDIADQLKIPYLALDEIKTFLERFRDSF